MGVLQAQSLQNARTALAIRAQDCDELQIVAALQRGEIVRTWLMRGTIHLVRAQDLRWIQTLVAPSTISKAATTMTAGGWPPDRLSKAMDVLRKIMPGAGPRTREALTADLQRAGLEMSGPMRARVFTHAAYEGLLCMGPMQAKEDTFVWLDDWVAPAPPIPREQALSRLAQLYFQSRSPASEADFANWAGLPLGWLRTGTAALRPELEVTDNSRKWLSLPDSTQPLPPPSLMLLPAFDEYLIAYKDRTPALENSLAPQVITSNGIFKPVILRNGVVHGTWERARHTLKIHWFGKAPKPSRDQMRPAVARLAVASGHELDWEFA